MKAVRFWMNSHINARRSLSRLMRAYQESPAELRDHQTFRNLVYSFSVLLGYWSLEKNLEIEERLIEVEERIENIYEQKKITKN